jgi:hypothetical protein
MAQFVETGPVIIDLLKERGLRRQLDAIERRGVEGAVPAYQDIGPGGGDERLGARDRLPRGQRQTWRAGALR